MLLLGAVCSLSAKEADYSQPSYQGDVSIGFGAGGGELPTSLFYLQTVHGIRANESLFVGVGSGFNFGLTPGSGTHIPIYANIKAYVPLSEQSSLFGSVDFGGFFGDSSGLFFGPAVGLTVLDLINVSFGYELHRSVVEVYNERPMDSNLYYKDYRDMGSSLDVILDGAFALKFGIQF